jgi:hypothetical protein
MCSLELPKDSILEVNVGFQWLGTSCNIINGATVPVEPLGILSLKSTAASTLQTSQSYIR